MLIIKKVKIPKTHKKPVTTIEFSTNHKETKNVERIQHRHPYKHLSIFGVLHPDKKPIINPPKPKPADASNELYRNAREIAKRISLCGEMISLVCQKYPSLEDLVGEAAYASFVFRKYIKAMIDNRWERSWAEWQLIVEYAKENTPKEASKKYSGITPMGKEIFLSPEYIKHKIPEVEAYWNTFQHYLPIFLSWASFIVERVDRDPELMEIYKKYAK